ncbi:MAG: hypothetical protein R3B52_03100 [Candidatus Paceibacterota bacterium]
MKKYLLIALATVAPNLAMAQTVFDPNRELPKAQGLRTIDGLVTILKTFANWMFVFLLIFAVIMVLVAAFKYLFAGGNDDKIKSAHRMLIYAAVAVAVGLLAQTLVFLVDSILGTNSLR